MLLADVSVLDIDDVPENVVRRCDGFSIISEALVDAPICEDMLDVVVLFVYRPAPVDPICVTVATGLSP